MEIDQVLKAHKNQLSVRSFLTPSDAKPKRAKVQGLNSKLPKITQEKANIHREFRYDLNYYAIFDSPDCKPEQRLNSFSSSHAEMPDQTKTVKTCKKRDTSGFSYNVKVAKKVYLPGSTQLDAKRKAPANRKCVRKVVSQQKLPTTNSPPLSFKRDDRVATRRINPYSTRSNKIVLRNHFGILLKSDSAGLFRLKKLNNKVE